MSLCVVRRRSAGAEERSASSNLVDGGRGVVGRAVVPAERRRLPSLLPHGAVGRHRRLAERRAGGTVHVDRGRRAGGERPIRVHGPRQVWRQSLRQLLQGRHVSTSRRRYVSVTRVTCKCAC